MEDTRLTQPVKLGTLLVIITLAMAWAYACATAIKGSGVLAFLRKFAGAVGVYLVLALLDWKGVVEGSDVQTETARQTVRAVSSFGPVVPLLLGAWIALRYPLRRADQARIRAELDASAAAVAFP